MSELHIYPEGAIEDAALRFSRYDREPTVTVVNPTAKIKKMLAKVKAEPKGDALSLPAGDYFVLPVHQAVAIVRTFTGAVLVDSYNSPHKRLTLHPAAACAMLAAG